MKMIIPVEEIFPESIRPILDELRNVDDPYRRLFDYDNLSVRALNLLKDWIDAGMPSFVPGLPWGAPVSKPKYNIGSHVD